MKNLLVNIVALIAISIVLTSNVSADYGEYNQPEPSLSIIVDKLVGKPVSDKGGSVDGNYVDNLSPSDPRFQPGNEVFFKLKVKNTSEAKLKNVAVTDFLPDFVTPVEGQGTFNNESREISINAGDLEVDEEKVFTIKVKILDQDQLPADKGLMCLVNKVQVANENVSDEDTAQFCIEKEVLGVTAVPSAGPEQGVALLIGQFSALSLGLILKRKSL